MAAPEKTRSRYAFLINLALSPDGRRIALHLGDHVEIWRIGQRPPLVNAAGPPETRFELERVFIVPFFIPPPMTGPTLVSGPPESHHTVRTLEFSPDGRRLVGGDGVAILWETDNWQELWRASGGVAQFALTPDGRYIVTACCVWELPEPADVVPTAPSS